MINKYLTCCCAGSYRGLKLTSCLACSYFTPCHIEPKFSYPSLSRYWDYMNLSVSLLDPVLYGNVTRTVTRSPFLFTVSEWYTFPLVQNMH